MTTKYPPHTHTRQAEHRDRHTDTMFIHRVTGVVPRKLNCVHDDGATTVGHTNVRQPMFDVCAVMVMITRFESNRRDARPHTVVRCAYVLSVCLCGLSVCVCVSESNRRCLRNGCATCVLHVLIKADVCECLLTCPHISACIGHGRQRKSAS